MESKSWLGFSVVGWSQRSMVREEEGPGEWLQAAIHKHATNAQTASHLCTFAIIPRGFVRVVLPHFQILTERLRYGVCNASDFLFSELQVSAAADPCEI